MRVVLTYQSSAGTSHTLDQTYAASQAQSGVVMSWDGSSTGQTDGGVSHISSMVVYKRDAYGNWQQVANQQGVFGNTGTFIDVAAPVDPAVGVQLQLTDQSGNWFNVPLIKFGDSYRYDASGLPYGSYQYRVIQVAINGSTSIFASGTLGLNAPVVSPITSAIGFGTVSNDVFSWASFGANYQTEFRYRPVGTTAWISAPVGSYSHGQDGVNMTALGAGQYEYELLVTDRSTGSPVAHATGVVTKQAAVADVHVPQVGYPGLPGSIWLTGSTSQPTINWKADSPYDVGVAILYYTLANGQQGAVQMSNTNTVIDQNGGESGSETGLGNSQFYHTFTSTLPAGTNWWIINYLPDGVNVTNQANGSIYQGPTSAGYYYTHYYDVQVGVQVWVPGTPDTPPNEWGEGGEAGTPGYWTTVYHTEQRSEQVWVPGTTPAPGIYVGPPNYQAAYTIYGHPAIYGITNTTPSHPYPISVSNGGATGVQTPVGFNGGTLVSRPTVIRTFDRWGNVMTVTDPRSSDWVTSYTYNANNQMTSEVRPSSTGVAGSGPTTHLYYDALGRNVAQRDADGNVNGMVYDAAGDLLQEVHADGGVVNYDYNAFGDKVTWRDAMGNVTSYQYDKMDRLLSTIHQPVAVYTSMNSSGFIDGGNVVSLVESSTYDQMGHRLTSTDGSGAITYYRYDLRGNVTGVRQSGVGVETRSAYDARGNKIFESDANSNGATWTYDYFGLLTGHKDIGGAEYTYTYNAARQLIAQTNTRGQNFAYSYDTAGQLTTILDWAIGQSTTYTYDNAGNKLSEKTVQNGVTYQDNHLAYDALGLLRDVSDGHVHESIDYDANGNRLHVQTTYLDANSNLQGSSLWGNPPIFSDWQK